MLIGSDQLAAADDERKRRELCDKFIAYIRARKRPFPAKNAREILELLQGERDFANLQRVADAFLQYGTEHPEIRRRYAQSLLEQGNFSAAICVLRELTKPAIKSENKKEHDEAWGLLGRAYKQLYLNCTDYKRVTLLGKSIDCYQRGYKSDKKKNYWHGINAAALLCRAARDRMRLPKYRQPADRAGRLAEEILDVLLHKKKRDVWDHPTLAEAYLVQKNYDAALAWFLSFAQNKDVNAFTLGSTLRQLEEVWQLDGRDETARKIVHAVRSALMSKKDAQIDLSVQGIDTDFLHELQGDKQFEKVLGEEAFNSYNWFVLAIDRAHNIAQIENSAGRAFGTGFLVKGSDVSEKLPNDLFLLTNAHVITENDRDRGALSAEQARVRFELLPESPTHRVNEIIWSSPKEEYDATLLSLDKPVEAKESFPISKHLPLADGTQRVYIIGHPDGMRLQFSIKDNKLLALKERFLHYRAPTMGGSSGSPVFNEDWELIGLHHAGGFGIPKLEGEGTYDANEGISMMSIKEQVHKSLEG